MNSTLSKLAAHGNGRGLNRRRSLHEWWEDELISKEGGSNDEQTCHRREGDIHKANNQVWSHLEGWLLEQTRPNWISAGV
jgi:hypothetical protein